MHGVDGNQLQNTRDSISPLGLNPEVRAHVRKRIKALQQPSVSNQVPCLPKKNTALYYNMTHTLITMPSTAEICQWLEAAREEARRQEEEMLQEVAEAEEVERLAEEERKR